MKTKDVLKHFGGQGGTARALGIKQPSVAKWGKYPPPLRQLQIERKTRGLLKAEKDCHPEAEAA